MYTHTPTFFMMILKCEGDRTAYHMHNFFCGYSKSFETFQLNFAPYKFLD